MLPLPYRDHFIGGLRKDVKMRVLIVEDEKNVANIIRLGLEAERCEVLIAADGEAGLKLALENPFDLILLDWMLPKKDGLSVVKDLRIQKNITPVLMLTARDSTADIVAALDAGSDDYLCKPFTFTVLLSRMRALVRRSELMRGGEELRFADLRLNPVSHKVWRRDTELILTAKEYHLLQYFMRNPNKVITRPVIALHAWDCTVDHASNIIDVYINYLRNSIGCEAGKNLIHTVRGQGYILKEETQPPVLASRRKRGGNSRIPFSKPLKSD
jgi:DNA-binding response OmpR family regulator